MSVCVVGGRVRDVEGERCGGCGSEGTRLEGSLCCAIIIIFY